MKNATPSRPATAMDPIAIPAAWPAVSAPSSLCLFAGGGGFEDVVVAALVVVVVVPVALETVEVPVLVAVVIADEDEDDELDPGRRFLFTLQRARRPCV